MSARSTYVRRLLIVIVAIAAVVGLGFAWRASPAAGLVADDHGGRQGREAIEDDDDAPALDTQAQDAPTDGRPHKGDGERGGGGGIRIDGIPELVKTMVIGTGVLAAVVAFDRARRRRRPVLARTRPSVRGGPGSGDPAAEVG